jgi:hypothetical protein
LFSITFSGEKTLYINAYTVVDYINDCSALLLIVNIYN